MESRSEKIRRLWKKIHGNHATYFLWENHPYMHYDYNATTDTIDCECGISVPINLPTEEITQLKLIEMIDSLELKVYEEYKEKHNIDLGYTPPFD